MIHTRMIHIVRRHGAVPAGFCWGFSACSRRLRPWGKGPTWRSSLSRSPGIYLHPDLRHPG